MWRYWVGEIKELGTERYCITVCFISSSQRCGGGRCQSWRASECWFFVFASDDEPLWRNSSWKSFSYLFGCIVLLILKAAAKAWGLLLLDTPQVSCLLSAYRSGKADLKNKEQKKKNRKQNNNKKKWKPAAAAPGPFLLSCALSLLFCRWLGLGAGRGQMVYEPQAWH